MGSQAALFKKALLYSQVNHWSVIPIKGESAPPDQEKEPAIFWTRYQTEIASPALIHNWFTGDHAYAGIGIVTGSISKLAVLDFDNESLYTRFSQAFPELTQTRTVLSGNRGLPHLYYRLVPPLISNVLSARQRPRGHRFNGADFQYGGYVLAPPTTIRGKEWRCIRDDLRTLTIGEYLAIVEWFMGQGESPEPLRQSVDFLPTRCAGNQAKINPEALRQTINAIPAGELYNQRTDNIRTGSASHFMSESAAPNLHRQLTETAMISQYHQRCVSQGGRNNALFSVALDARNDGWLQNEVKAVLVMPHASNKKYSEDGGKRLREAERTIASAFSRPPRETPDSTPISSRVPNSLREYLLTAYTGCFMPRVYESLLTDLRPHQLFTVAEALTICGKYGVGKWSVEKALSSGLFDAPPPQTPPPATAEIEPHQLTIISCRNDRGKKPGRKRGKATLYTLPSPKELIKLFDLDSTGSDRIPLEALQSVATYRAYKLKAMLPRFKHPRRWKFAQILGVTGRTIYNYFILLELRFRPKIQAMRLTWGTISKYLPKENETIPGAWLQTANNRLPAKWPIAAKLLAANEPVNFCFVAGVDIGPDATTPNPDILPVSEPSRADHISKTPTKKRKTRLKGRDKALADTIYTALPELSYKNAERYIHEYGRDLVKEVWEQFLPILKKGEKANLAGYLATMLRVKKKGQAWN